MAAKPFGFLSWPKGFRVGYGPYRGIVDRHIDADTLLILCDLGMGEFVPKEIRMLGYSSPESSTPEGIVALDHGLTLAPRDTKVQLFPEKDDFTPTFSRWAAMIQIYQKGSYAHMMFDAGHAREGKFKG